MKTVGVAFLALAAVLSGCEANYIKSFNSDLQPYVGRDVHAVIAKLGYPASQRVVVGDTVYSWSTQPVGTVVPGEDACTLEFITDTDGKIKSFQWQGGRKGCNVIDDRITAD